MSDKDSNSRQFRARSYSRRSCRTWVPIDMCGFAPPIRNQFQQATRWRGQKDMSEKAATGTCSRRGRRPLRRVGRCVQGCRPTGTGHAHLSQFGECVSDSERIVLPAFLRRCRFCTFTSLRVHECAAIHLSCPWRSAQKAIQSAQAFSQFDSPHRMSYSTSTSLSLCLSKNFAIVFMLSFVYVT